MSVTQLFGAGQERHADDGVLRLTRHQLTHGEHHVIEHL